MDDTLGTIDRLRGEVERLYRKVDFLEKRDGEHLDLIMSLTKERDRLQAQVDIMLGRR